MYKPILTKVSAFDCTKGTTFSFGWKGAQAFANELVIKDAETLQIVYKLKIETMSLLHEMNISLGTTGSEITGIVQNGRQYQAEIAVFDKEGTKSDYSDPVTFWCFSKPELRITNKDVLAGVITMSSLYLNFYYNQKEGEPLNEYYIELYDDASHLLQKSKTYYGFRSEEYLEYRLDGLTNNHTYQINVVATTVHGLKTETGKVKFSVKYDKMGIGALIRLKDIGNGNISIGSNFKILDVKSNPEDPTYINNEEIDLRKPDSWVEYFDGFKVSGNYELKVALRDIQNHFSIIFKNENEQTLKITYHYFYIDYEDKRERKYYFRLTVGDGRYIVNSKLFDKPDIDQNIVIDTRHKNGFYAIDVQIGNKTRENRMPYKMKTQLETR